MNDVNNNLGAVLCRVAGSRADGGLCRCTGVHAGVGDTASRQLYAGSPDQPSNCK